MLINNAFDSPWVKLHQRLAYQGRTLDALAGVRSSSLVREVSFRHMTGPRDRFRNEVELLKVARFIAGDHMNDYPQDPSEKLFLEAVRELLPQDKFSSEGIATPMDLVIVSRT